MERSFIAAVVGAWLLVASVAACTSSPPDGTDLAAHDDGGVVDAGSGADGGKAADGLADGGPNPRVDSTAAADSTALLDAAGVDASPDASPAAGKTRYPPGAVHSPLTTQVVARVAGVLAASSGRDGVFAKVGDSITADANFLNCFSGSNLDLAAYASLEPTRAFFHQILVDPSHTSFNRTSLAAKGGWSAAAPLRGDPSFLEREVDAIHPVWAVLMFGTNDTSATGFFAFERNLRADIDALLGLGVVPLVSTIPPRGDSTAADALVPEMNAVIRALAQARQLPLMDLHATLVGLPDYGMSPDGVHPQAYRSPSGVRPCWFTPEALQKGMNQRNLLVLTALDRVRRMVLEGEPAEAAPPALAGDGTLASPFVIPELPFVDDNDTSKSQGRALDVYDCAAQDESGPEIVYRLILSAPARLRARVFVDDGVDVDLHWLDGPTADRCLARADKTLELEADAGEYWLVADSYVSGGQVKAGSYRLTVVELP